MEPRVDKRHDETALAPETVRTTTTHKAAPMPAPSSALAAPRHELTEGFTRGPGYLFVCSDETEAECFSRKLFGLGLPRLPSMISGITEGETPLFLLNFQTRIIHGVFEAVGAFQTSAFAFYYSTFRYAA